MNLLSLIPSRVWWALGGAMVLGLLIWAHQWNAGRVIDAAIQADRAAANAAASQAIAKASEDALREKTRAATANLEVVYELSKQRDDARAGGVRAAGQLGGLRNDLAALRRGENPAGNSAGPRSLADAAPALAAGLEQCGARYSEVEASARELSVKVTGLQSYIKKVAGPVCIDGMAPDSGSGELEM